MAELVLHDGANARAQIPTQKKLGRITAMKVRVEWVKENGAYENLNSDEDFFHYCDIGSANINDTCAAINNENVHVTVSVSDVCLAKADTFALSDKGSV